VTISIKFNGKQTGRKFQFGTERFGERVFVAATSAAKRAKEDIETEGRADIRAGGNFGSSRWQDGFEAKVSYQSRSDINIRVTHGVPYWRVFEFGATIKGKPLLWIPLDFATDAKGVRARDYPGPLFRVDRPGKAPLLISDDGPKYFGKESVTIKKKWHLRTIVRNVAGRLNIYYREAMSNGR
jgi:hypothetical protein